ncbi:MAG: NYN domain-containing protein [Spirochaetaceae bacterium]|nr:NYN domain-containing protein [Spirochaetaceae bacterium]
MDKKYAVFIDGDNISSEYLDIVMAEIAKDGEILIKRIYGDWTTTNMNSWKDKVFNTPVRIFQQFRFGPNATDNSIIMDAIELTNQNKDINAFCIVSIDADYYSLALRLRENGKYVFGIGKENSKVIWQNSCNKFVKIENIAKEKELEGPKLEEHNKLPVYRQSGSLGEIIEYGLENSRINDDGWISFSDFGATVRSKYPSFDTRTYNYKNLLQLIKSLATTIEIKSDKSFPPNYWLRRLSGPPDEA